MTPSGRPGAGDFRTHTLPAWMRVQAQGVQLSLRVQPGAKRSALLGAYGDRLKVAVQAPPADGRANDALLRFLGSCLDLRLDTLQLVSGAGARDKRVLIQCDPALAPQLAGRLAALCDRQPEPKKNRPDARGRTGSS